jgi:hypothetical protein
LLVLIAHEADRRSVLLAEYDMSDYRKPDPTPCRHKQVGLVPSVKADAERVWFKDAIDLREGRFQPTVIVIVYDALAVSGAVSRDVGRVSENEINTAGRDTPHNIDAIALQDHARVEHVNGLVGYDLVRVHGSCSYAHKKGNFSVVPRTKGLRATKNSESGILERDDAELCGTQARTLSPGQGRAGAASLKIWPRARKRLR